MPHKISNAPRLEMKLLDLTLKTPAENLACDEALLDRCDNGDGPEVLRFWESNARFVAVGYSNQVEREVNVGACREKRITILRRSSGGGTVVQGPGCLNYAVVLQINAHPELKSITSTNRFVMERNRSAIQRLVAFPRDPASGIEHPVSSIAIRGHTDLAIGDLKFSGNAQRRRRRAVLFHGSFLLNFDLAIVNELLPLPSTQPDYRRNRGHGEFLTNLGVDAAALRCALADAWNAINGSTDVPLDGIRRLVAEKYSKREWNLKH